MQQFFKRAEELIASFMNGLIILLAIVVAGTVLAIALAENAIVTLLVLIVALLAFIALIVASK